jgi:hypothetical protein
LWLHFFPCCGLIKIALSTLKKSAIKEKITMKLTRKITALFLCICLLIGLPISLDVLATGRPEDEQNFDMYFLAVQALMVPDEWNTGLKSEQAISLYFTGNTGKSIHCTG